ncbi:hypothetical protein PInf_007540 [Phytophthora infestans]|nr:hypothetical protein PInf_007540 [Phytophthora infestans]
MDAGEELQPDEIIVDSEDLQVMRDSVDKMHQQLSRGLRDIQEIRDLVKQAAAQREREQREMDTHKIITEANSTTMTKRSPYDFDGSVSLAAGLQRTRKKKRRESPSVGERKANEAWLASALHPVQQNDTLQAAVQLKAVDVRLHPYMHMAEKRAVQTQAHVPMSVQVLEQKKMLLPYLDKIEYINCQLRQRGLLPAEEKALVKDERSEVTTSSQLGRKPPTRSLPAALATRNQDEQDTDKNTTANTASVKVSTRMLQIRYPRFFEMAQANKQQTVLPRQRGINWLLRMIEVVYNALADILLLKTGSDRSETELSSSDMWVKPNSGSQSRLATPGWLAMPFFTRRFIHHSLGLPELADQECLDLMYNIELTRELYPQVSLFASFLREIYDEDTRLFFLFVRSQLQDEFDLDLAAKEKQAHSSRASGSKKYITANMIELRNHPLIPDGTKQVFLSSAACEGVMLRVFESARRLRYAQASKLAAPIALARYIVREPIMFEEVAEDILAQFKFNDDGESLSNLIRLRDTITLDSKVEKFVALYAEQERTLRNQKIELMKMERKSDSSTEQELQHVQKKIVDGENQVNNVWNDVIAAKASSNKATVQRTSGDSLSSKALISVLGRFEAQIGRLQKKHDIAVKASMLLAVPWQQQMDELRLRMVIRIQRAYRARKRRKKRSQELIREREIKMKNQELERKRLDALREKGMERHQQRLKARKEQEDKQKRDLEEKQKKVVKRAREEEATQRAVAMKKKELVHVMTRWNLFVIRKKNRRKAHLLFLKFKLMKWKLHLTQHKQMTRAARTIQRFIHRRQEQKQLRKLINVRVKRTKMAKRGRVARQVFKYQRDRHRKAVAISECIEGIEVERRQIKATQDKGVEVILRRVRYREAGLCFDMIVRYTYWERRIKEMTHARKIALERAVRLAWIWRRHKATKYVAALRTEKILLVTYKGDYTTVKRAIDNGFWYVTDNEGNSILHVAAAAGHKRLVKLCLRNSFDINGVNTHSQTALHLLLANLSRLVLCMMLVMLKDETNEWRLQSI